MNNISKIIIVTITTLILISIAFNVYKTGKRIIEHNNNRIQGVYDELLLDN